jgi:hypothetical protein
MESRVVQEKARHKTSSAVITTRKMRLTRPKTRLRVWPAELGATGSIAMHQLLQIGHILVS